MFVELKSLICVLHSALGSESGIEYVLWTCYVNDAGFIYKFPQLLSRVS